MTAALKSSKIDQINKSNHTFSQKVNKRQNDAFINKKQLSNHTQPYMVLWNPDNHSKIISEKNKGHLKEKEANCVYISEAMN